MSNKNLIPQPDKSVARKPVTLGKGLLTWFSKEAISNWIYEQLGALWRSAIMTTVIALVIRFASSIPLDLILIALLFVVGLIFFSLQRFIEKRRNKQSNVVADESGLTRTTAEEPNNRIKDLETARTIEQQRTQIGRLQEEVTTQHAGLSFRENELGCVDVKKLNCST